MEKGFDINEIEVKDSNKNIEKLLTGDVEIGLQKGDPRKPNAEIEGGEYIKLPQGNVKKAEGPKHTQGGIKTNLPENTEVISDSIYLTKSEVLKLEKEFEVNLSTKDTYATALDKYSKKIGLKKLNDEQEDIISLLKKEIEKKSVDKGTSLINNEYLSNKIYDIESKKKPLEDKRKKFFDKVFDIQESKKKQENKEGEFKFGGVQEQAFQNLLKKHNMSEDEGRRILSGLPKFADGGEFIKRIEEGKDNPDTIYKELRQAALDGKISEANYQDVIKKYYAKYPQNASNTDAETATLTPEEKTIVEKKWNGDEKAYLNFKTISEKVKDPKFSSSLYEQYKKDIESDKNYTKDKKGSWYSALKDRSESEVVEQLLAQEERNARLEAYGLDPEKTDQSTAKGARTNKQTIDFINQHKEALGDILPGFEKGYIGQAAYISYNNLLSNEKSGYKGYKKNQTGKDDEALGKISSIDNDNTNTTLGHRMSGFDPIVEEKEKPSPQPEGEIKEDIDLSTKQKRARAFHSPDQSVLPPGGQQPEMLVNNRFQRIDPIRIGIESQLQSGAENRNFLASQIDFLPPAQRAAALSSLLSTTQSAENEAILGTNITNAQNISAAEQFNIGQSDRENIAQGSNLLNFEGRSLTAKAKTEADLREYLKYNHNVAMNKFSNDQQLNLISNLTPDYALDYYGMGVNYDPYYDFQIKNNDQLNRLGLGPTNTTEQSVDEEV